MHAINLSLSDTNARKKNSHDPRLRGWGEMDLNMRLMGL